MSLVESLVSIVIVGVLVSAALSTVGAARLGEHHNGRRRVGHLLAQALMSEIMMQNYAEPVDVPRFGPELPETADSRADYDDVDDYDGWSASPPQGKDGTALPNADDWTREVAVIYANPITFVDVGRASDTGLKRITVTVLHHGAEVARIVVVRAGARQRLTRELALIGEVEAIER